MINTVANITMRSLRCFKDKSGASLVEYAIALAVVVVVGLAGMSALGQATQTRVQAGADAVAAPAP